MRTCLVMMLVLVSESLLAQNSPLEQDLERMRTALSKTVVHRERLRDMYYRQAMGLPVAVDEFFELTDEEVAVPAAKRRSKLAELQRKISVLKKERSMLRNGLDKRKKSWAKHNQPPQPAYQPIAGGAGRRKSTPVQKQAQRPATAPLRAGRATAGVLRNASRKPTRVSAKGPMVLIKGSKEHSKVGRVLYRAGQYEAAVRELEPLAARKNRKPHLIDLFYLALAYERLATVKMDRSYFDKANDVFSRIEALDSKEGADGKAIYGRWAMASRTARQTMLWVLDSGNWKPVKDVQKIQWRRSQN